MTLTDCRVRELRDSIPRLELLQSQLTLDELRGLAFGASLVIIRELVEELQRLTKRVIGRGATSG